MHIHHIPMKTVLCSWEGDTIKESNAVPQWWSLILKYTSEVKWCLFSPGPTLVHHFSLGLQCVCVGCKVNTTTTVHHMHNSRSVIMFWHQLTGRTCVLHLMPDMATVNLAWGFLLGCLLDICSPPQLGWPRLPCSGLDVCSVKLVFTIHIHLCYTKKLNMTCPRKSITILIVQ